MLGTTGDVTSFDVGENLGVSSRVQAVVDFFGPTDFLQMDAHRASAEAMVHDTPDSPESQLIGGPIRDNTDKVARANPITYVTTDDPPFLIVHGDTDLLVPHHQSELLDAALRKAGVRVRFVTIPGGPHGGETVTQGLPLALDFLTDVPAAPSAASLTGPSLRRERQSPWRLGDSLVVPSTAPRDANDPRASALTQL